MKTHTVSPAHGRHAVATAQGRVMEVSQGSDVCAALCIPRTLCKHVTIGTPMVIFPVLTVFWLFLTVFDDWYTVVHCWCSLGRPVTICCFECLLTVLTIDKLLGLFLTIGTLLVHKRQSKQKKMTILVYQSSQAYQDCTNSVPIVKNSQKTVKTAKMTVGVPIVTCLHRVRRIHKVRVLVRIRVRRIHKARIPKLAQIFACGKWLYPYRMHIRRVTSKPNMSENAQF